MKLFRKEKHLKLHDSVIIEEECFEVIAIHRETSTIWLDLFCIDTLLTRHVPETVVLSSPQYEIVLR